MRLKTVAAMTLGLLIGAIAATVAQPQLALRGDRFRPLKYEELTPAQRVLADRELASPSRSGGGPLNIYLRNPEYAELARPLTSYLRLKAPFPEKLKELTIMLTGRFWGGTYVWWSHRAFAIKAGLSEALVASLAKGERPVNMAPDETAVYDFVTELLATRKVSDATYKAFIDRFSERDVVDVAALMGAYHTTSMLFAIERYPLPPGEKEEIARPM